MENFLQKHGQFVTGVLSGFDRLIFRGSLGLLTQAFYLLGFLKLKGIDVKNFGAYAKSSATGITRAACKSAEEARRPVIYLPSAQDRKELKAREMAERDGIDQGLVVLFKTVEPCMSFEVFGNRERPALKAALRKCLHLYHYFVHPKMGLMHVRVQTWFPFNIQVYVNGREWLGRMLDEQNVSYRKSGNCFTDIADFPRAQQLLESQLKMNWAAMLDGLAQQYHPTLPTILKGYGARYHWSAYESEWATDVAFKDPSTLARLYPRLTHHAITSFDSPSVMRFLGGHLSKQGQLHALQTGPITTSLKRFPDCVRVRHAVKGNSVKLYNKEETLLRVETTIHHPKEFKVYRAAEGGTPKTKSWRPMRKGVADMKARAVVSQASNDRYLNALAVAADEATLGELLSSRCRAVLWKNRRVRGLQPLGKDEELLKTISRGEFILNGFRNRDLRDALFATPAADVNERHRQSARITRHLRMLRAHGLIEKVRRTHRYQLTPEGRTLVTALIAATRADPGKLMSLAA
ncbi:MAG TPA: hypothetical protein VIW07_12220 [Candidatus Udaeobacter sp.]|jgi:hypothetical protein